MHKIILYIFTILTISGCEIEEEENTLDSNEIIIRDDLQAQIKMFDETVHQGFNFKSRNITFIVEVATTNDGDNTKIKFNDSDLILLDIDDYTYDLSQYRDGEKYILTLTNFTEEIRTIEFFAEFGTTNNRVKYTFDEQLLFANSAVDNQQFDPRYDTVYLEWFGEVIGDELVVLQDLYSNNGLCKETTDKQKISNSVASLAVQPQQNYNCTQVTDIVSRIDTDLTVEMNSYEKRFNYSSFYKASLTVQHSYKWQQQTNIN